MGEKSFLSDASLCIGCGSCQIACKEWNDLPAEESSAYTGEGWTNPPVFTAGSWSRVKCDVAGKGFTMYNLKCLHCFDPACLKVCPEKAIYKSDDWTVIDTEHCIGCGACVTACPYGAVKLEQKTRKALKCHGCVLNPVDEPPCAALCPTGALRYDYRKKLIKQGVRRVGEISNVKPGFALYGLSEQGGLGVLLITDKSVENAVKVGNDVLHATGMIYSLLKHSVPAFTGVKRALYRFSAYLARLS